MTSRVQIKLFEHVHQYDEDLHYLVLENEINTFLLTLPAEDVIGVGYNYLPIGNPGRPHEISPSLTTRCIGIVSYRIMV